MSTSKVGDYLEEFTFDYYMNEALKKVPEGIDKREGAIIYDALAPACYELANFTLTLKGVMLDSFTQTATGHYLDLRAEEHGIKRVLATKSKVKGRFTKENGLPMELELGNRFSSIGDEQVYYSVIKETGIDGEYILESEISGTKGNQYLGTVLALDHFNDLASAELIEVTVPARDTEDDETLRERILKIYQVNTYGGNVEDYINFTMDIDGVGAVQVYPVWNGGGTVKVVILNNNYGVPSELLLNTVQEMIYPVDNQKGYGIAPIGHNVTVASPTVRNISVTMHVDTDVGVNIELIKPEILSKLSEYFKNLRKFWSNHDEQYKYSQTIYRSQLLAFLLQINGISNISNIEFDGIEQDLILQMDNKKQEISFLGEVNYK